MKKTMWMVVFSGFLLDGCACSRGNYVSQQTEEEGAQQPALPPAGPSSPQERLLSMAKENPKATAGAGVGVAGIVWLVVDFIQSKIRGTEALTVQGAKKVKGLFQKKITVYRPMTITSISPLRVVSTQHVFPLKSYNPYCWDVVLKTNIADRTMLPTGRNPDQQLDWQQDPDAATQWKLISNKSLSILMVNAKGAWQQFDNVNLCVLMLIMDLADEGDILQYAIRTTEQNIVTTKWLNQGYQWHQDSPSPGWSSLAEPPPIIPGGGGGGGGAGAGGGGVVTTPTAVGASGTATAGEIMAEITNAIATMNPDGSIATIKDEAVGKIFVLPDSYTGNPIMGDLSNPGRRDTFFPKLPAGYAWQFAQSPTTKLIDGKHFKLIKKQH